MRGTFRTLCRNLKRSILCDRSAQLEKEATELNFIVETATPFGLRLSPAKCELICFHRPGSVDKHTLDVVTVGDKVLSWKSSVVYLGSHIAEDGKNWWQKHRICCAEEVVKRLSTCVFERRAINISSAVFAS